MTTWDSAYKYSAIVLSNGDRTATLPVDTTWVSVLATDPAPSGHYFEVIVGSTVTMGIGLANRTQELDTFLGRHDPAAGFGYYSDGNVFEAYGHGRQTWPSYTTGDIIGVELLVSTAKVYKNGTLVGTIPALPTGNLYPALTLTVTGSSGTGAFGDSGSLAHLPSGDSTWAAPVSSAASLNPDDRGSGIVLSGGNLTARLSSGSSGAVIRGNIGSLSGNTDDWQFEVTIDITRLPVSLDFNIIIGVANPTQDLLTIFDGNNAVGLNANGNVITGGGTTSGTGFTNGDVIGVEKNIDNIKIYINGTLRTTIGSMPEGVLFPAIYLAYVNDQVTANFGATSFAHAISGAVAWGSATLSARNIVYNKTLPSLFQVATMDKIDLEPLPSLGTVGGYFPDTIGAVLVGNIVRLDLLVMFDFLSGPMRLWQGFGTLHTNDGHDWQGIGQLGQISDLESAIGGTAPQAKFVLSGVDPVILADALDQQNEIFGRDCNVYMQFFDENFVCLDNPYVIWAGLMDTIHITQTVDTCQVEMTAETIFARRAKPPLGMLSDREQQQFFPGDNSLTGIPALMSKTSIWPVILPQS